MQYGNQSYFGDVLRKLSEIKDRENIPVDEGFKAKLKEELRTQDVIEQRPEEPVSGPKVSFGTTEPALFDEPNLVRIFKKWQALVIGLPALIVTVAMIFVVRWIFFGEQRPETIFEKNYNVSYIGPFSDEERKITFRPIIVQLVKGRDSESVRLTKKHSDEVLIKVKIKNDGAEEFLIAEEGGKWHGKQYALTF